MENEPTTNSPVDNRPFRIAVVGGGMTGLSTAHRLTELAADVVLYHIYKEAWQKFDIGMASAMSYVLFAMIVVVALIQLRLMRDGMRGVSID